MDTFPVQKLLRFPVDFLPVYQSQLGRRMMAQTQVFRYRKSRHIDQFLKDHGDSQLLRHTRRGDIFYLSMYRDGSLVRLVHSVDYFHQGRFSGSVLTYERMNRTLLYPEAYMIQSFHARKCFCYVGQLQCIFFTHRRSLLHCKNHFICFPFLNHFHALFRFINRQYMAVEFFRVYFSFSD